MKITEKWLKEQRACGGGCEWFRKQKETDSVRVLVALTSDNQLSYANWLIVRLLNRKDKIRYAIFAAEQVIGLYEAKHPGDLRSRKAIEAARAVVKNDTKATRAAAAYAADAAADAASYAAAYAADAAAYAAYAADAAAAYAAAASYAAAYAADAAAAYAAAYVAAYADQMRRRILAYGLGLLEGRN
jgi:hypothetical protein